MIVRLDVVQMTEWDKILSKGIVKKSVALHPLWDYYIRKTWAMLVDTGYDASYSTALNYMLLTGFFLVVNQGIDEETRKLMRNFLEDEKTIRQLNHQDLLLRFKEALEEII